MISVGTVSNGFPPCVHSREHLHRSLMSLHSYSRVWLHAVWGTLERRPMLNKTAAVRVSSFLYQYSSEKGIYMKLNYVNSDHVHVLVDLPTNLTVEELMHLLKGASSHWINENNLSRFKFAWGSWLWCVFGFTLWAYESDQVRRWAGRSPSQAQFFRGGAYAG